MKYGIGQAVLRREDGRLLRGRGSFVDDLHFEGQCHVAILYSDRAHARISSIDTAAAAGMPGVLAVLTGQDLVADGLGGIRPRFLPQDLGLGSGYRTERTILAVDRVRHVGERVALVAAETREAALDAVERIEVDYEPLDAVIGIDAAIGDGAPLIHEDNGSNEAFTISFGDAAATQAGFAAAAHVVSVEVEMPRVAPAPMEPRAAIGIYDPVEDQFTLHSGSQAPHILRSELASFVFGCPETSIRVVSQDVGGGFGLRTSLFPEDALVLWVARRLARPARWLGTRSECMLGDDQGRGQKARLELALDGDGCILALKAHDYHDVGAYIVGAGAMPAVHACKLFPSVYRVPAAHILGTAVFTNAPPTTPYRGAGRPEAVFAIERALDEAATKLGLDRFEIRRRNYLTPDELPFRTPTGFVYDSGEFAALTEACREAADLADYAARKRESKARGQLRGLGIAYYTHDTGNMNDRAEIRFDPSGSVTVFVGSGATGQGHETVYAQIVSGRLGVPFERVRVVQGDSGRVHYGRGSYASRSMTVLGSALLVTAEKIIENGKQFASRLLEAATDDLIFEDGRYVVAGTDRAISLTDVAKASFRGNMPIDLGVGLEASGGFAVSMPSFPNGCHICEVEIDSETGQIRVDRYCAVDDFGRIINPQLLAGQVHGALAQGIGEALKECMVYDPATGQLACGTFMDYAMPTAQDMPDFSVAFKEVPCTTNPLGVKGAGEGGTVAAPAALLGAVRDALAEFGAVEVTLPITSEKIWAIMNAPL